MKHIWERVAFLQAPCKLCVICLVKINQSSERIKANIITTSKLMDGKR